MNWYERAAIIVAVAIGMRHLLQLNFITYNLTQQVGESASDVFEVLTNPKALQLLSYAITEVNIKKAFYTEDDEYVAYITADESFPYVGIQQSNYKLFANRDNHTITLDYSAMKGMVQGKTNYVISTRDVNQSTVTQETSMLCPYVLLSVVNKTKYESDQFLLENIQTVIKKWIKFTVQTDEDEL